MTLAATDALFATCSFDCSDSGGLQGMMLLVALGPVAVFGAWRLVRSGVGEWDRRLLLALAIVCAALFVWLVLIFVVL